MNKILIEELLDEVRYIDITEDTIVIIKNIEEILIKLIPM